MRIISGTAGGLLLRVPQGDILRPTQDKVRAAIFSSLAHAIPDARVMDIFAGTGAMGLEALSRGAASCTFVEKHPRCLDALRHNIAHCKLQDRATITDRDVFAYLRQMPDPEQLHDIIFADPPYLKKETPEQVQQYYHTLCQGITQHLAPRGIAVIGYFKPRAPASLAPLNIFKEKHYGQTSIIFLHHPANPQNPTADKKSVDGKFCQPHFSDVDFTHEPAGN